ncbi:hypothetical protein HYX70_02420 [Candidatus Saccharibacteria bacterium]|nr:hypothetical protein [Candidatus Saccharibacteria bacterium]
MVDDSVLAKLTVVVVVLVVARLTDADGKLRCVVGGAAQYGSGNVLVVGNGGAPRHGHGQATATTPKPAP